MSAAQSGFNEKNMIAFAAVVSSNPIVNPNWVMSMKSDGATSGLHEVEAAA